MANPELRRAIGRRMLLFFIVGDVLGGGIYVLVGQIAGEVGGAVWVPFTLALVLALFTAGSYAELATRFPFAGGASLYVHRAFGSDFLAFIVGFAVLASGVASAATLARAFGGDYLREFVHLPVVATATGFLLVLALINLWGIAGAVRLNVALTLIELLGLALIVAIGVVALVDGSGEPHRAIELGGGEGGIVLAILAGTALSFYALIGFEDSANVAEETRDPRRAYPFALFGGLAIAGILYVAVTVTASMVVPAEALSGSSAPLLEVVQAAPVDVPGRAFSAIGLVAISNGALINLIMASRLLYGMARDGVAPRRFERLLPGRKTPVVAIALTTALAVALAATGGVGELARTAVALLLAVFVLVNVSVLALRRLPAEREHFRVPTPAPVLGALGCATVMTQIPLVAYARAVALLALGLALWIITSRRL
ncbi:MAG: APC family permease [Solirubrobacterales bacterium]